MALFNEKLIKRIEALEEYLGVHYTVDSDQYRMYVESEYAPIRRSKEQIKELQDKVKEIKG